MPAAPLYLDVRAPEEHAEERLESCTSMPVDSLESRLNELGPKDVPTVTDVGSFEDAHAASEVK